MYLYAVMLMKFLVDLLLLLAANRLAGCEASLCRCLLAALLGGLYGGLCMLEQLRFAGGFLWRLMSFGIMGVVAFGLSAHTLRRCALFSFLSLATPGVAGGLGSGGFAATLSGAALVLLLCYAGFRTGGAGQRFVEVELAKGEKRTSMLALRDTGNSLRDPVTGQSVLIADAQSALVLLGLTAQQLRTPIETVASGIVPGLRLIPYRTIGSANGMLVAIRLEQVRIGKWRGSSLVAFAPEGLGESGSYRALTGGMA